MAASSSMISILLILRNFQILKISKSNHRNLEFIFCSLVI
jgi:hypothetical protein